MEYLCCLQLILAFIAGLASFFMHRKTFLLGAEIVAAVSGLTSCLFPRAHCEFFGIGKILDITVNHHHLLGIQVVGSFSIGIALLSYLTRIGTNDERVSLRLMHLWSQGFVMDVVFIGYLLTLDKAAFTTTKSSSNSTGLFNYDFSKASQTMWTMELLMAGLMIASIIHQVRWPVFRAQIRMSTDNRVNVHLIIEAAYMFLFGLVYLIAPHWLLQNIENPRPLDVYCLTNGRILGCLCLIIAQYAFSIQDLYSDSDKAPYFYSMLFIQLTAFVQVLVHHIITPGGVAVVQLMIYAFLSALIVTNRLLGALQARRQENRKGL